MMKMMYPIRQDNSCIVFSLSANMTDEKIIDCISHALKLIPFKDVVIREDAMKDDDIISNAILFVDILRPPYGCPVFCSICSSNLKNIIPDWIEFLKQISHLTSLDVFIDFSEKQGYLIKPAGIVHITRFVTEFYEEHECLFLHNEDGEE